MASSIQWIAVIAIDAKEDAERRPQRLCSTLGHSLELA
jgi:hypothetical protein